MMTVLKIILALAIALPATAQAQGFYYQSTMPDGRMVIGDKPAPGAKDVKKMPLTQGNTSAPLSTPGQQAAPIPKQEALNTAEGDVKVAEVNLAAAKAALEAGREPQAGERTGVAKKGSTQLTDAYRQRLKSLEDGVATAQKQLDDAYARRNAAR